MTQFQGWTPTTVDNLTFDQLDAIISGLNKKARHAKSGKKEKTSVAGMPSSKGTRSEVDAWCKAGCPSTFSNFVRKSRKKT